MKNVKNSLLIILLSLSLLLCSCVIPLQTESNISLSDIPAYSGKAYVEINGNVPYFTEDEYTTESYESYSDLDLLGRCGVAIASIGVDIMPTEERESSLQSVTPSGWHSVNYDGKYLYHRCHLIGFQLTGENANEKNLITGTAYMNVTGMLPFENSVAAHVVDTEVHVLYRVTPIYDGNNLVASGVLMEAYSIEDGGELSFCVYVYNVQPGITIDYATGESTNDPSGIIPDDGKDSADSEDKNDATSEEQTYVLNTSTKKYHLASCTYAQNMKEENREERTATAAELEAEGYTACGVCH